MKNVTQTVGLMKATKTSGLEERGTEKVKATKTSGLEERGTEKVITAR